MSELTPIDKYIRKIRKKLRQIEHLELLDRDLNDEELSKVIRKDDLRDELQQILLEHHPDDVMKRPAPGGQLNEEPQDKKTKSNEVEDTKDRSDDSSIPEESQENETVVEPAEPPQPTEKSTPKASVKEGEEKSKKKKLSDKQDEAKQPSPQVNKTSEQSATQKQPQQPKAKAADTKPVQPKLEASVWKDSIYKVYSLKGHNDIILSVDCSEGYILSASRDTTVRVWRVGKTVEERTLRGHTATVTSVSFLPGPLAAAVLTKVEASEDTVQSVHGRQSSECGILGVSGGLDCTLKVWDVVTGESFGSIYTFNGIACLACGDWGVVTGTEGGRLEIWCIVSGQRFAYVDAFQSQVTSVYVQDNKIFAGSIEGELGIWKYDWASRSVSVVYIMEDDSLTQVKLRQLSCLVAHKEVMFLGDSGPNVKKVDWRKNSVTRYANHVGDIGMTDSLSVTQDGHLLSASYYVDAGYPSINVRKIENGEYICSLICQGEGRYLAMSCCQDVVVTGGHDLKVWLRGGTKKSPHKGKGASETVRSSYLRKLTNVPVDTSDGEETDWGMTTDDDEDLRDVNAGKQGNVVDIDADSSSWCTII